MSSEGDRLTSGLETPRILLAEHFVSHGGIVLADGQVTLGYAVRRDKRVVSRDSVRDTKLVLVTPLAMDVVEIGEKKQIIHDPFDVNETHKATRVYVKPGRKVVRLAPYVLDFKRDSLHGSRNLALRLMSVRNYLHSKIVATNVDVESLQVHMDQMALAENIVFEG